MLAAPSIVCIMRIQNKRYISILFILSGFSLFFIFKRLKKNYASVMKLVDMGDSKSPSERSAGSSPAAGTTF